MKKIVCIYVFVLCVMMCGCESLYYSMAMDKSSIEKGEDESPDVSRMVDRANSY
ncbi:MAG: hypothetical protein P9M13_04780 [Candidatus Ancaeobacter aquaticus]|nr:hypothetical protein [Candidatus Ancaeobacter aquaticus]